MMGEDPRICFKILAERGNLKYLQKGEKGCISYTDKPLASNPGRKPEKFLEFSRGVWYLTKLDSGTGRDPKFFNFID